MIYIVRQTGPIKVDYSQPAGVRAIAAVALVTITVSATVIMSTDSDTIRLAPDSDTIIL